MPEPPRSQRQASVPPAATPRDAGAPALAAAAGAPPAPAAGPASAPPTAPAQAATREPAAVASRGRLARWRVLARYARPCLGGLLLSTGLGFATALLHGASTTLVVPVALETVGAAPHFEGAPAVLRGALAPFADLDGGRRLAGMALAVLGLVALKGLSQLLGAAVAATASRRLVEGLRADALRVLLEVDLDFHGRARSGDLLHRITGEVGRTAEAVKTAITLIGSLAQVAVLGVVLVALSWRLALGTLGLLAAVVGLQQLLVSRARLAGRELSEASRRHTRALLDTLRGIRVVKEAGAEERELRRLVELGEARAAIDARAARVFGAMGPLTETVGVAAILLLVALGRVALGPGALPSAVLLTYLAVAFRLLPAATAVERGRGQLAHAETAIDALDDLLDRASKPFMRSGSEPFAGVAREVRLEGVSFAYPGTGALVLDGVALDIPRGRTLALVGRSGAGKSTVGALLARFYDPDRGRVTLDGRDLRDIDLASLRRGVAVVAQDPFLFAASVRENVSYARPDASAAEIERALRDANAWDVVLALPGGLDAELGDQGAGLSGGERQRLAIARALLKDPALLILDEATSALDGASEAVVLEALARLRRDRTTLVIAHRLSTVLDADEIAVLEGGRVVERGTHAALLAADGAYGRLYRAELEARQERAG